MALTRRTATKLTSARELELFDASQGQELRSHDAKELSKLITRARRLRDKQRDLLRRQRLATRRRTGSKGGPAAGANQRTAQKAELFEQVLARFEERLAAVEAGSRPSRAGTGAARRKAARKKKAGGRKKAASKKAASKKAAKRKAAAKGGEAPAGRSGGEASKSERDVERGKGGLVPEPSTRSGFVSPKAKLARQRRQPVRARQQSIQAHAKARGKRNQARRDDR